MGQQQRRLRPVAVVGPDRADVDAPDGQLGGGRDAPVGLDRPDLSEPPGQRDRGRGFAVATLVEGSYPQGTFASSWDGTAHDGQEVARGVYVYRSLPDRTLSRTLTSSGDLHASTDSSPGGYPCLSRMGRSTNRSVWLHRRTLPIDHTPIGGGPASGHPLNGRAAPPTARTSYPQPGE